MNSLLKALIQTGIGSRRQAADAIVRGVVKVNGVVVDDLGHPVDADKDRITVDGCEVDIKPKKIVYLMFNKPAGVLSTVRDDRGRRTVIDLLPEQYRKLALHPVGRLDKDTTGLLLLTNDGDLTYRLTHPKFEHEKEYLVRIDGIMSLKELRALETGIDIDDGLTHRAIVRGIESNPSYNYSITIHEGRKRQVRRMFSHLGYRVTALKRVRIGDLRLGGLAEGGVRRLDDSEVGLLVKDR
ncbi:MAG: pseudouridine synthase [Chloroflexota bacterium]|nr:pseudouridine synthase [Chloroflexota bacterium]